MRLTEAQKQPYLQQIRATVISCQNSNVNNTDSKSQFQKSKNNSADNKSQIQQLYDIILNETCMYHESGGQLSDCGTLKTDDGKSVNVFHVRAENDEIIHSCSSPLESGSQVTVEIDWNKRYCHMQLHSGQHLISAVAFKLYNAETLSWWMSS